MQTGKFLVDILCACVCRLVGRFFYTVPYMYSNKLKDFAQVFLNHISLIYINIERLIVITDGDLRLDNLALYW